MEHLMKRKFSYLLFFIIGAVIGGLSVNHIPDSFPSFLNNGVFNPFLYGAVAFGICAILNKEYKKLLWVPVIFVIAFIVTIPLIYLLSGAAGFIYDLFH